MRHASAGTDLRPIEDLELPVGAYTHLKREGVDTIGRLATMTEGELLSLRGMEAASVSEVRSELQKHGYEWEDDV
jgi:DNA-directed RNA polymerase subunit alpha